MHGIDHGAGWYFSQWKGIISSHNESIYAYALNEKTQIVCVVSESIVHKHFCGFRRLTRRSGFYVVEDVPGLVEPGQKPGEGTAAVSETDAKFGMPVEQSTHYNRRCCDTRFGCIAHRIEHTILTCSFGSEYGCRVNENGCTNVLTGLPECIQSGVIEVFPLDGCANLDARETKLDDSPTHFA